jgi:hypothetical protein
LDLKNDLQGPKLEAMPNAIEFVDKYVILLSIGNKSENDF